MVNNKGQVITFKIIAFVIFVAIITITASTVSISAKNPENIPNENYKIDERLREIVTTDMSNKQIPVVIIFKEQPANDVSQIVKNEYKEQFENITKHSKKIYRRIKPQITGKKSKNISELITLEQSLLTENEKILLNDTAQKLESKTRDMRRDILGRTVTLVDGTQAPIIQKIMGKGGKIRYSSKILNAIAVDLPISYMDELSREQAVYKVFPDYVLNETLDISTQAMGANTWWGAGYNGSTADAAIVDTGIDGSQPALNVDYAQVFHDMGKLDYYYHDNRAKTDDLHGHGTHVAGIVASTDPTYRGAGYGIDKLINAKAGWLAWDGGGYMYFSDAMQAFDWAIFGNADDADVISYSFGGGTSNGEDGFEHFIDAIVYDLDIPVVVANGNAGPGSGTVGQPAGAYNIISVGNIDDKNTVSRADDILATSSSRGPTIDGRIKPDISAPGTNIMSANNNWETQNDFISHSGTSMAAPQITGSVLLILNYKGFRWKSETIKALLLNSAEDKGIEGPDSDYGFGYVDLSNAYYHKDDVITDSINNITDGSVEKYYKGNISAGDKITLVWNRHINYSGASEPTYVSGLSNLDLYLYNGTNGMMVASSTSTIDNVEQVKSNTNYSSAIVKVDPYGTFPINITVEDYALATYQGFARVNPPILNVTINHPENVDGGADFTMEVNVTNLGELTAYNVSVNMTLPIGFSIVSGENPGSFESINNGSSKNASWVVKAPRINESAQYTLNILAISRSYGESFSGHSNNTIMVIEDAYVNGTVWSNGTVVSGAIVTSNASGSITTNSSGFYSLRLPTGTHNFTATIEPVYYPNSSVIVGVVSGTTVWQDIELVRKPTGTITGSIT